MSDILARISECVVDGNPADIASLTEKALREGVSAADILNKALVPAMGEVGAAMDEGEMFIPEVLQAAQVMQAALDIIRPGLSDSDVKAVGKVVLGTVKGDLHTIGKNLVKMMLDGAGFEVVDLGYDVSSEKFVEAVKENKPDILGMSAMLTTTMQAMNHTIQALREAGLRDRVKVIVGGAPVTQQFTTQIGADEYAANASAAVQSAKRCVGAI